MAIDTSRYDEIQGMSHEKIWSREVAGHEVARMRYSGTNIYGNAYSGEAIFCECDFVFEEEEYESPDGDKGIRLVKTVDSFHCSAKEKVRNDIMQESQDKHGDAWNSMGVKEAILDIYNRVNDDEYLGQRYEDIIYIQEVAELLEISNKEVWRACDELFKEERLDLNGAILSEYKSRFRFPKEIQSLFAFIIEDPLGWPNGDAGDGFLYALENAIHENTSFKHGKDAFYEHNYPNLATEYLIMFGLMWLQNGAARIIADGKDSSKEDLDNLIRSVEKVLTALKEKREQ